MAVELPVEVLLLIVSHVDDAPRAVAHPASHPTTRTLLSLCLVSSALHSTAARLLYSRCVYVDTPLRIALLCRTLGADTDGRLARHVSALVLRPFTPRDELDLTTSKHTVNLLGVVADTLERLVIDIPLRFLYPEDDTNGIRPLLRHVFERLKHIREFCSAQDELFLDASPEWPEVHQPEVWPAWPKLRRLALYNPIVSLKLAEDVARHAHAYPRTLTHLFFARPDLDDGRSDDPLHFPAFKTFLRLAEGPGGDGGLRRIAFINVSGVCGFTNPGWMVVRKVLRETIVRASSRNAGSPASRLEIVQVTVEWQEPDVFDNDCIRIVQEWMRDRAADGTLWDVPGVAV